MPRSASAASQASNPTASKPRAKAAASARRVRKTSVTPRKKPATRKPRAAASKVALPVVGEPRPAVTLAVPSITHGHETHRVSSAPLKRPALDRSSRHLVMWIGVSGIMMIVVVGWIMSLRSILGSSANASPQTEERPELDLQSLKQELSDTMSGVKKDMENLSSLNEEATASQSPAESDAAVESQPASGTEAEPTTEPIDSPAPATLPE